MGFGGAGERLGKRRWKGRRGGSIWAQEERVDIAEVEVGKGETEFLEVFCQREQEWKMLFAELGAAEIQTAQRLGEFGEEGVKILLPEESVA